MGALDAIVITRLVPPGTIRFDAFTDWSFEIPKTVTKHPVVPSPEISDHVQIHGATLSFRGYIGTPAGVVPSVTPAVARAFFDLLGGSLCVVTTPFGIYTNVVVHGRESGKLGSLVMDVRGEQVRLATLVSVPIPPRTPNPAAAAQASSAQDAGTATSASASATAAGGSSLLATASDAAQGLADLFL